MITLSKFHKGSLNAIIMSILDSLKVDNYRKALIKLARLILFSTRLRVNLYEVLPHQVRKLFKRIAATVAFKRPCFLVLWTSLDCKYLSDSNRIILTKLSSLKC